MTASPSEPVPADRVALPMPALSQHLGNPSNNLSPPEGVEGNSYSVSYEDSVREVLELRDVETAPALSALGDQRRAPASLETVLMKLSELRSELVVIRRTNRLLHASMHDALHEHAIQDRPQIEKVVRDAIIGTCAAVAGGALCEVFNHIH